MKIAVVSGGRIPSTWASSINTVKHADAFFSLDNSVELFTISDFYTNRKKKQLKSVNDFYGINQFIPVHFFKAGLFYYCKLPIFNKICKMLLYVSKHELKYIFSPEKKIAKRINAANFDFVYSRSLIVPYFLIHAKFPVIVETHNPDINNPRIKKLLSLIHSPFFIAISTISNKLKQNFVNYGVPEEKVIVQEDAVEIDKFSSITESKSKLREKLSLPLQKKIITYCGSLRSGKAIPVLLEVARQMQVNQEVEFLIVGGPDDIKNKFMAQCKKQKINNIHFTGFVPNKQVPFYLKASDVLIMLYSYKEKNAVMDLATTSPIKLFEYMASGVPVVVSKIPTIEKIVVDKKDVLMPEADDIPQTIKAINNLLENQPLVNYLAQNSLTKAKKYSYKNRCKNIIQKYYESLPES